VSAAVPAVVSVNVGMPQEHAWAGIGRTSIDKRPVAGRVACRTLGLDGDQVSDTKVHGGVDQAVYADAREDLDTWQDDLDRPLSNGTFGENLTTGGVDVTGALIGERWRIGADVVLEVNSPRIPCNTFARWMDEQRWVKRFTARALPGAYLRVVTPGTIRAGDPVEVVHRPTHGLSVGDTFRALTTEPALLPRLVDVEALPAYIRERAIRRTTA